MRATKIYLRSNYTGKETGRKFNRDLLPDPSFYYNQEFQNLKFRSKWVKVCCCFHDDSTPSLSINIVDGHFRCFACGVKGGDVLAFHILRYEVSFVEAVNHFGAWDYE